MTQPFDSAPGVGKPKSEKLDGPQITVAIACYNEEPRIINAINHNVESLQQAGLDYEIVVIDDCSRDASAEVVHQFSAANPSIPLRLHRNERNRGLAFVFGLGARLGCGKYYRLACGDDPQSVDALTSIYKYTGAAEMVIPYMTECHGRGVARETISTTYTALINMISGYRIRYYNGSPIYLREHVMCWHPSSYGFGYSADMITRLLDYEGVSFTQVPTTGDEKKGSGSSSSSMSIRNLLSVTHSLLEIGIRRIRRTLYGRESPRPIELERPEK